MGLKLQKIIIKTLCNRLDANRAEFGVLASEACDAHIIVCHRLVHLPNL